MAYPTDISVGEIAAKKPMTTTLWGKVRDWIYYLLHNSITGPVDFTCPVFMSAYESAFVNDHAYHRISRLISLPAPPTGKKWRIAVRFYFTRTGTDVAYRYLLQIWDYEGMASVSIADTTLTGTGARWVDHYLYATTTWTNRYLNLSGYFHADYTAYRLPSVKIDMVDV